MRLTLETPYRCIQALASYQRPKSKLRYPKSRSAAVLVALFVGRMGDIYVLLSKCAVLAMFRTATRADASHCRRATSLRTYAGDTALPGGKWEPHDKSVEWTAVSGVVFDSYPRYLTQDL